MKRFDYYTPHSLAECVEILKSSKQAVPIAGGTDLIPKMKRTDRQADTLVSLRQLQELEGISRNGSLVIGAATRLSYILGQAEEAQVPAGLIDAIGFIGSRQIRNIATLGGNLCNAAPSADAAPPLLALDAHAVIANPSGERRIPLHSFFQAPGQTALMSGELLKQVELPRVGPNAGSCYLRHTPRERMDLAVVGVGVSLEVEQGAISSARIALGAVSPTPLLAEDAASELIGQQLTMEVLSNVAARAVDACSPIDDIRASAAYRRHLVMLLVKRATAVAYERAVASSGGEV